MAGLRSLLPRFVALPLAALFGTATLTFAADSQLSTPTTPPQPAAEQVTQVIVVPDVRRQAYVFAKGTLEDAGFAWRVIGSVGGYAANTVLSQSPAPGTRVVDTGAPLVTLTLAANSRYVQKGTPENTAPYGATVLELAGAARPAPAVKPAAPAATPKPAAKPKAEAKPKAKKAVAAKRPAAFAVAGAPKEPLDEMPLVARAQQLAKYVESTPKSAAAADHFTYQHSWIVTGARFGWWHGAQALEVLIRVDQRVQARWGIGAKSEALARAALAYVKSHSR
ncbi:MAG TPA: PASTA domain-containing protein [Gaiellaceae bacterium]|nr:PASTA domain-containing protein [Gaiellaceae bacterium]